MSYIDLNKRGARLAIEILREDARRRREGELPTIGRRLASFAKEEDAATVIGMASVLGRVCDAAMAHDPDILDKIQIN